MPSLAKSFWGAAPSPGIFRGMDSHQSDGRGNRRMVRSWEMAGPRGVTVRKQENHSGENRAARPAAMKLGRATHTSLRRFDAAIPGRLRPRRACVRFAARGHHATSQSRTQCAFMSRVADRFGRCRQAPEPALTKTLAQATDDRSTPRQPGGLRPTDQLWHLVTQLSSLLRHG